MQKGNILIVDDEEKLSALLARIVELEGFNVARAGNCKQALKRLATHATDVVLCDVKLPDGDGISLVAAIKQQYPDTEVILLTAYGNIPDGVQAIKNGAFDYMTKGDDNNKIIPLLYRAIDKVQLARRVQQLEQQLGQKHSFNSIVGNSKAMAQVVELARKVAVTDTTVLLTGETGTGKEVFAQAIHQGSKRSRKQFVAINCSAFSKDLLESEMFGHRAGAFTGATTDQKGLFEEAHQGTIFLDEIGELALDLQAKLLRVLETGVFIRVGDTKPTQVDVRVVAATNRNLEEEVKAGRFREDLYYRISVFQLHLPPLRERVADIPALVAHFLQYFAAKTNQPVPTVAPGVMEQLQLHQWKGNIRELKNAIERAVILADERGIQLSCLPIAFNQPQPDQHKTLTAFDLASAEKQHISKVLGHTNGNKTKAAELLGIALTTLYRKIEEYQLNG